MNETSFFSYPLKLHLSLSPLARNLKIMSKEIKVPLSPLCALCDALMHHGQIRGKEKPYKLAYVKNT